MLAGGMVVTDKVKRTLEFHRVLEWLEKRASFEPSRELARSLPVFGNSGKVLAALRETTEARRILEKGGERPGGFKDLRPLLQRACKGGTLSPGDLLDVLATLREARRLQKFVLSAAEEQQTALAAMARQLPCLPDLEKEIAGSIDETGEVADDASPVLSRLRNRLRSLAGRIRDRLEAITRSSSYQGVLQEPLVTTRRGRFVVPVKQEHRSRFPGVIHDQSASGATLFIEPMAVVELNNQLRQAEAAEEAEVERILRRLASLVAAARSDLEELVTILSRLDLALAKGRLSLDLDATEPVIHAVGLEIKGGRHPLLTGDVVPLDVFLSEGSRTLVITGPNTGGKTVLLKTVGLFALMAQAGLHVPALPGTRLRVFPGIFADIGDEQSIEQNLSTFSGHMANIVEMLGRAIEGSLFLLDEIGAGTDPVEGAALARALLEHLHRLGAWTLATTHFGQLKTFAYAYPGVENASMDFDPETLKPTFRVRPGLPGRSHALEIARRLGLDESILQKAGQLLRGGHAEMEEVIEKMELDRRKLEDRLELAGREKAAAERLRRDLRDRWESLRARETEILKRAREEAWALLKRTQSQAGEIIRDLRRLEEEVRSYEVTEGPDGRKGVMARAEGAREGLRRLSHELQPTADDRSVSGMEPDRPDQVLKSGDRVLVAKLRSEGTFLHHNDRGQAVVQIGAMRIEVPPHDLRPAGEETHALKERTYISLARDKLETISPEIHLRGLTVEEAVDRLDKYLDDALLAGLRRVTVIHGKGTGTLRDAVRSYLESHPGVVTYREGGPGEGREGATIAELADE